MCIRDSVHVCVKDDVAIRGDLTCFGIDRVCGAARLVNADLYAGRKRVRLAADRLICRDGERILHLHGVIALAGGVYVADFIFPCLLYTSRCV